MKVAIGAVVGPIGGPATYAIELVRALVACFPDDSYTVCTDRPEAFAGVAATIAVPMPSPWLQPVWDHVGVARCLRRGGYDLYHGTKGVVPRFGATPSVVTIHDLADRVLPETFRPAQRMHLAWETPAALRRARAVITVSEHSAADLHRFFPASRTPIHVVPHGVSSWAVPAAEDQVEDWKRARGIQGRAIGYLGTLQPRKNLELLYAAFRRVAADRDCSLLIAGRSRPGYRPAFLDVGDSRVRHLGVLPETELPLLFGALACMVSPSAYEGFGLTFLESMACGTPVVGLRNSSVAEVVGDAGLLVDQADEQALASAVVAILDDPVKAARLARAGSERAGMYDWNHTAEMTRAVYERAIEGATL